MTVQVCHVAYSADSMALFGDVYLRDDEHLHWKPGMLEFNFHLTEVQPATAGHASHMARCDVCSGFCGSTCLLRPLELQIKQAVALTVPSYTCLSGLQELYRVAYGEPLAADGVMFRGTPPPLWRTDPNPGEPSRPRCGILTLTSVFVCNVTFTTLGTGTIRRCYGGYLKLGCLALR